MGSPEKRTRVLERLDSVERSLVGVSRTLLWLALLGVMALVVAAIVTREPGGNTQGEYYYFGVAILIVLGWIIGQLAKLRSRERRANARRRNGGDGLAGLTVRYSRDSAAVPLEGGAGFVRSREFRFGSGPDVDPDLEGEAAGAAGGKSFTFSRSFEVPLASLPPDAMPDDTTLDVIAAAIERGETLEHLCAAVQPAYRDWSTLARKAYRFLIEAKLEERSRRGGAEG